MSVFELFIVLVVSLVGLSIVWTTVFTGISPMPSSSKARVAVLELVDCAGPGAIVELGSGWGHLLIPLARKYPNRSIIGFEVSWVPWLVSCLLKRIFRLDNLVIHRENFLKYPLPQADLLVCYLFPGGMRSLAKKLKSSPNAAQALISNCFALPNQQAETVVELNDLYRSKVYFYRLMGPGQYR